ncbi:uncharacterized protein LOC110248538 [Exaiptasia diaphana]|uniref:Uncharacterized protein n=1 Tax=Exaiptasia diaphana TaxID=2652724 RepID=A0A913XW10_EXADI|nr:uncharacterized protein LOC110246505 [Exaiptasia diaphana]XP_020910732.1 uncharacterized protein LOC110248538 [Exaiptasia diaphana]
MAEGGEKKNEPPSNSYSESTVEKSKHIDRLVLLHFFVLFVSSFALGLIFLHSSLTFWRMQFDEDGFYHSLFGTENQGQYLPKDNTISVVSYNANSSFSLVR